jgi:hypothetical protein
MVACLGRFFKRKWWVRLSISSTILIFFLTGSDLKCRNCILTPQSQSGRCFRVGGLSIAHFFLNDPEMFYIVPVFVASGLFLHSNERGNVRVSKPDTLGQLLFDGN